MPPTRKAKKWTAKCSHNQGALDRLVEHRESKDLKDRYSMTLKRAIESLQATTDPITTYQQAKTLKYVGDHIASLICPPQKRSTPSPASSAASATSSTNHRQNRHKAAAKRNLNLATIPEIGKKQKIYDNITKASDENWKHAKCWRVLLLIDERERESRRMASACEMSGIPCEVRTMPIADMGWIAQGLDCNDSIISELVLGTLVERKTPEDLKASLFGTRYQEQRLRLKNSGVPQILFLIEGELRDLSRCPLDTLLSAVWETRLHVDFQIVETEDLTGTVRLLKRIHRRILQRTFPQAFSGSTPLPIFMEAASAHQAPVRGQRRVQSLAEMTFDTPPVPCFGMDRFITYMELKAKVERDREAGTRTVRSIHLAMLKQVPTFSNVKCEAIARVYPTPRSLLSATLKVSEIANIPTKNPKQSQKLATIGEKSASELVLVYGNSFQLAPNPIQAESTWRQHGHQEDYIAPVVSEGSSKTPTVAVEENSLQPPAATVNYFSKASSSVNMSLDSGGLRTIATSTLESSPNSLLGAPHGQVVSSQDKHRSRETTMQQQRKRSASPLKSRPDIIALASTLYAFDSSPSCGQPDFPLAPPGRHSTTPSAPTSSSVKAKRYASLSSPEANDLKVAIARSKEEVSNEVTDLEMAIQLSLRDQKRQQPNLTQRLGLNTSVGSLFDDSSDDDLPSSRKLPPRTKTQEVIEIDL